MLGQAGAVNTKIKEDPRPKPKDILFSSLNSESNDVNDWSWYIKYKTIYYNHHCLMIYNIYYIDIYLKNYLIIKLLFEFSVVLIHKNDLTVSNQF